MWIIWIMITPWLYLIRQYVNGKFKNQWHNNHAGGGGHW